MFVFCAILLLLASAIECAKLSSGALGVGSSRHSLLDFSRHQEVSPAVLAVNSPVYHGVVTTSSYFNTNSCSGDVYATQWVTLGSCSVYKANYSDPAAPAQSCGSYVSAMAYTGTDAGTDYIYLMYHFYTDSACTVAGTGNCTRTVNIVSGCQTDNYDNITSYISASLVETYTPPAVGYSEKSYPDAACGGTSFAGIWYNLGCIALSTTESAYATCVPMNATTAYQFSEYSTADCSGTAGFVDTTPLVECRENIFNEDDTTAVVYGWGYTSSSCVLSVDPTAEPSAEPTAMPTDPSARPTMRPTHKPSAGAPTAMPTKSDSPIVTFTSNATLAGVTSPTLNTNAQNAIISATAKSMDIAIDKVAYVGAYSAGSTAGVVLDEDVFLSQYLRAADKSVLSTYTLIVVTRTTIALSDTTYTSTTELYNTLTQSFDNAVTGGSYADELHDSGVSELATVVASNPASSPEEVIYPFPGGDDDNDVGLSAGAIAGIVIAAVFTVAVACGVWFYYVRGMEDSANNGTARAGAAGAAALAPQAQVNPVLRGKRGVGDDQL